MQSLANFSQDVKYISSWRCMALNNVDLASLSNSKQTTQFLWFFSLSLSNKPHSFKPHSFCQTLYQTNHTVFVKTVWLDEWNLYTNMHVLSIVTRYTSQLVWLHLWLWACCGRKPISRAGLISKWQPQSMWLLAFSQRYHHWGTNTSV